jgi:carbon storage regulator
LRAPAADGLLVEGNSVSAGEAPTLLVLTRKSKESIMIGDEIEISVLAIMGEKVRIGIEAPRSVPVFRREVYVEMREDDNSRRGLSLDPG